MIMDSDHHKSRYDTIGKGYDESRRADPYLVERFIQHLGPLNPGELVLEIGSGTGNYTIQLQRRGLELIGVEPSVEMIEKARSKSDHIDWIPGKAENLPIKSNSVDGVVLMLTIHHWDDLLIGFREIHRVLKPGKRVVLFTSYPRQTASYWLKNYFPVMTQDSADFMPTEASILSGLKEADLHIKCQEKYDVRADLEDLFFYSGKHRPELYLDPDIRKGISSFSLVANQQEVDRGLIKLKQDIESGQIEGVVNRHQNDLGDYMFLIAEKA